MLLQVLQNSCNRRLVFMLNFYYVRIWMCLLSGMRTLCFLGLLNSVSFAGFVYGGVAVTC